MDFETEKQTTGDSVPNSGLQDLKDRLTGAKRGRGRPKGSCGSPRLESSAPKPPEVNQAMLDELYKGENWEEVASLPFNVRKIMTGSEIFNLSKTQKSTLGTSLATMLKTFEIVNPKYVAMSIFFISLSTIWAEKEIEYSLTKPKKEKEKTALKVEQGGIHGGGYSV